MTALIKNKVECNVPSNLLDEEPEVNLKKYFRNSYEAGKELTNFETNFESQTSGMVPDHADNSVVMSDFMGLREKAKVAANKAGLGRNEYITSLKIMLGMIPGSNVIKLLYQPVYCIVVDRRKRKVKAKVLHVDAKEFYTYGKAGFTEVSGQPDKMEDFVKAYRKDIWIRHERDEDFSGFDEGDEWKHDTESAIFSFQEIYCLYFRNYENDGKYKRTIRIRNCAVHENHGIPVLRDRRFKHSFLLQADGREASQEMVFYSPYSGDDANLAHLCPPSKNCDDIQFPV